MSIFRLAVMIPSEVYIDVDTLEDAESFIELISEKYDKVAYPISSKVEDRAGVAEVKCLSIEHARMDDRITARNSTKSPMHQPVSSAQTPTGDDDGPSVA